MRMAGGFVRNDADARDARELRPKLLDDLVGRQRALAARLQIDVEARRRGRRRSRCTPRRSDPSQDVHDLLSRAPTIAS